MPTYQPVAPHIIENILLGACPEREAEMRQSWETFKPEFNFREDAVGAAISANGNRVTYELRHVQFAAQRDAPPLAVEEERACDVHERSMLLDRVADYCTTTGEPHPQVLNKRIMGLATAAFCIAHVEPAGLQAAIADTHPPLAERFKALVLDAAAADDADGWVYTACLLMHLLRRTNRLPPSMTFASAKELCRRLVDLL
ncbi:peptidase U49, Lit peptidase [Pseudoxanthomonas spadix BD-a59]|uniref:Peptidase U49, Lit peptidase n=1 Tax=Pseudoxanthomonas spadix (strain BD-a59) TaxID=1045855 RepID=G7UQL2_PSEUP|nr:phage exclusion protein Lit family protein [Pseudoxanthomonas spadix]AER57015.1 peptidase U49, Lit peptidase [Pseudoxanthomonas spadix BD-a59]